MVRRQIRFTGRVQGVGFRFRASHAARSLGLTGWVKNEWDGSVEMEVQGTPEQIDKLLAELKRATFISIEHIAMMELPLEKHESDFRVRGY